ncbi:Large ribosomal subunit protein P2 [Caenorhabditis elegans]|uniref:Large ribosomal subunit protein P2 n=1 Tax=Caenorhabditis elegans TaxID=6239 RepID=Q9U1X9_CAEEL|nr:Large ribosomal subunit protein P2 [Caenorhabditis elegans]CAB60595.1 Large ribosomal subunit protein P2 [Caenorhabditis elegans]|eukprot:NP_502571.1 Ribosomal protein, Large subunit, Acidic (P1) [Caenorhabditis elegans]
MRYVSAYLLAVLGGNANPKVDDLKNILSAVGVDADAETAKLVVSRLAGKTVEELIAEGSAGLVSVSGGAAPAAAAAPAAGGAAPAADSKPAKKEEPKEESDDDMGFGLFD